MSIRVLAIWGSSVMLAFGAAAAVANNGNPPTAHTGAPAIGTFAAERLCNRCHGDFALNLGGSVQLLDVPTAYAAGVTYPLRLRITSSLTAGASGRNWGFELTAVSAGDGTGVGTFGNISGQGTTVVAGSGGFTGRSYAVVSTGDHAGAASPVEWQVNWTAPASPAGAVSFYFVGVAGDGSGDESGDYVYTGSSASQDATPNRAVSWGGLKARYR